MVARSWKILCFVALAGGLHRAAAETRLPAPPSLGGGTATAEQVEAVKHLDVANVALREAALNVDALYDISAGAAFDRGHAVLFTNEIDHALLLADAHLHHLEPLAAGPLSAAADPLARTEQDIVAAREQLTGLRRAVASGDARAVHGAAAGVAAATRRAFSDFNAVASAFGYDVAMPQP